MMLRVLRCSVTVLVVAATVTGCVLGVADSEENAGGKGGAAISASRPSVDLTLPLDAYVLTPAQQSKVQGVRFALVAKCLKTFGLDFKGPSSEPITYPRNAVRLGWLGDPPVEKYGYHPPVDMQDEILNAEDGVRTYSISDDESYVLSGKIRRFHGKSVPRRGCGGEVESILSRGARSLPTIVPEESQVQVLADGASERATKDDRLRAADHVWSGCMKRAGFDYATPITAQTDRRWASTMQVDHPEPHWSKAELDTATADHRCRLETNYYGVRRTVHAQAQQWFIDRNPDFLQQVEALNQAYLKNAAKVAAGDIESPW